MEARAAAAAAAAAIADDDDDDDNGLVSRRQQPRQSGAPTFLTRLHLGLSIDRVSPRWCGHYRPARPEMI